MIAGCRILCYGRHRNPEAAAGGEYVSPEELSRQSDVISLHLALTPETHHIINRESIGQMKDGVVLINCARGGLMDIHALIDGMEQDRPAGHSFAEVIYHN